MDALKNYIIIFFLLLNVSIIKAQTIDENQQILEELIENIVTNSETELDFSTLYDDLNYFFNNPINLNTATREELERLQFLNDIQIDGILDYLNSYGDILSIYELQLIKGFTKDIIIKLLPFVTIELTKNTKTYSLKNAILYGRHEIFLRNQFVIQNQKGYTANESSKSQNSRYLGDKNDYYVRYKYHYKDAVFWGFTMQKDPGEEFFKGTQQNGFDFYSGFVQINNQGIFKRFLIGDFQAQFGQGLVLASGLSINKSSFVLNIQKNSGGIKKFSSTDENNFFRGIATTVKIKNIELTGFYSNKKIDANVISFDSIDNEAQIISSIQNTGLHSTPSAIEDKHSISEKIFGGNILFRTEKFRIGATFIHYLYSAELNQEFYPYNQFNFRGTKNYNAGIDYYIPVKDIKFFGEAAISSNGAKAFINGAVINLAPQISLSILNRHFDKNYQANYANAFAENSSVSNEDGWYIGSEIHPYKYWKVSVYFDTYTFPWLRYRTDAPSNGFEYFTQIDYFPNRKIQLALRFKQQNKSENLTEESSVLAPIEPVDKKSFRFNITYYLFEGLKIQNRIEFSFYNKATVNENGFMIYQDICYDFQKIPLSIDFRYSFFDATYNCRIYAYENDVLYGYSFPAYFDKGSRTYITLKYAINKYTDIWLRYAQTFYSNKSIISENSLNEINGNIKSDFKIQLRIKF